MSELLQAAKAFMAKWDQIAPAINGAFIMSAVHGGHYSGPTIDAECKALRAAIAKAEGEPLVSPGRPWEVDD